MFVTGRAGSSGLGRQPRCGGSAGRARHPAQRALPEVSAPGRLPVPTLPSTGTLLALGAAAAGAYAARAVFDRPSRPYSGNVGAEYDAWTSEGILEHYWGEHIHLGYYTREERERGYKTKDFIQAKHDFVGAMLRFSGARDPATVLDVGCGIGGTTRSLARAFPHAQVTGMCAWGFLGRGAPHGNGGSSRRAPTAVARRSSVMALSHPRSAPLSPSHPCACHQGSRCLVRRFSARRS